MCGIWGIISTSPVQVSEEMSKCFQSVQERGYDGTNLVSVGNSQMGFHRLAIVGLGESGNQPFHYEDEKYHYYMVCNGEIYNYQELNSLFLTGTEVEPKSGSDCEVLFRLLITLGKSLRMSLVRGVYAGVFSKLHKKSGTAIHYIFRDTFGVRPLYYAITPKRVYYSSTLSGLNYLSHEVKQFPPGNVLSVKHPIGCEYHTYKYHKFHGNMTPEYSRNYPINLAPKIVRESLIRAVRVQSYSDRPICCLLSGGVDSSLVASILAYYSPVPIHTFTISTEAGGLDVEFAEKVAKHIGSIHTHVRVSTEQALGVIPDVIRSISTYDTTTVRASTWQYLICQYIAKNTDFKVVFCGDGSDEVHGSYLYFKYAPSAVDFDSECRRLVSNIHHFDVRRADGATSCHALELRVPFLDTEYVTNYLHLNLRARISHIEKQLLRAAFNCKVPDGSRDWLPIEVLNRRKEAFSDSTSTTEEPWRETVRKHVSTLKLSNKKYTYLPPVTDEMRWYRELFEQHFQNRETVVPYFWMPKWILVPDGEPSARVYAE